MKYLEGVALIRQIESEYDVMSIRFKGVSAWSYLRLYLLDKITDNREFKASRSIIALVLRCLFFYSPFQIFKHYDAWVFTGCERRKRIGDKMIQRVSGGVACSVGKCLMIEKPSKQVGHYKREEINEKSIVSEAWALMTLRVLCFLSKPFPVKLENEELMRRILQEKGLDFDYKHYLKLLNAQRMTMRMLMAIVPKPKMVFMESPYDTMGYMWAFRQVGVMVIELQHGVLNRNHYAYNACAYEKGMNPDCICVFGEEEYNYFIQEQPRYAPEVRMTGLYMLELADSFFNVDLFAEYRKKYDKIIVAAGQSDAEKELSTFVNEVARRRKDILFFYIPRLNDADIRFSEENVVLKTDVNIYEYLKWANVHLTNSSTTCLESHYFHTPTIFFDFNHRSTEYYGHILFEENGAMYIQNSDQFDSALNKLLNQKTKWKELFAHNHAERIKQLVQGVLSRTNN